MSNSEERADKLRELANAINQAAEYRIEGRSLRDYLATEKCELERKLTNITTAIEAFDAMTPLAWSLHVVAAVIASCDVAKKA